MNKAFLAGLVAFLILAIFLSTGCGGSQPATTKATQVSSGGTSKAGIPVKLVFVTQPAGAKAGVPFNTQPVIMVQDADGNKVDAQATSVTIIVYSGPGGSIYGTTTVDVVGGLATFKDLSIDKAGTGYVLIATSRGLTSAKSEPFDVTP